MNRLHPGAAVGLEQHFLDLVTGLPCDRFQVRNLIAQLVRQPITKPTWQRADLGISFDTASVHGVEYLIQAICGFACFVQQRGNALFPRNRGDRRPVPRPIQRTAPIELLLSSEDESKEWILQKGRRTERERETVQSTGGRRRTNAALAEDGWVIHMGTRVCGTSNDFRPDLVAPLRRRPRDSDIPGSRRPVCR